MDAQQETDLAEAGAETWTLDMFELLHHVRDSLGKGSFGIVQKIRRKGTNQVYAMKSMRKLEVIDGELIDQVELEIQVQRKLKHKNVLRLYRHFEDDEQVYLLLEYCSKGELYKILRTQRHRRFNEQMAWKYFVQVVDGLQYLHANNIVHRDIKPENLLVTHEDVLKIADFGWCAESNGDRTTFCGTLDYLAPEMISSKGHNHTLDIWGAGVLLYEMLVGRPPFQSTNHGLLIQKILTMELHYPQYFPEQVQDLVNRLLRREPSQRLPLAEAQRHPWMVHMAAMDLSGVSESRVLQSEALVRASETKAPTPVARLRAAERSLSKSDCSKDLGSSQTSPQVTSSVHAGSRSPRALQGTAPVATVSAIGGQTGTSSAAAPSRRPAAPVPRIIPMLTGSASLSPGPQSRGPATTGGAKSGERRCHSAMRPGVPTSPGQVGSGTAPPTPVQRVQYRPVAQSPPPAPERRGDHSMDSGYSTAASRRNNSGIRSDNMQTSAPPTPVQRVQYRAVATAHREQTMQLRMPSRGVLPDTSGVPSPPGPTGRPVLQSSSPGMKPRRLSAATQNNGGQTTAAVASSTASAVGPTRSGGHIGSPLQATRKPTSSYHGTAVASHAGASTQGVHRAAATGRPQQQHQHLQGQHIPHSHHPQQQQSQQQQSPPTHARPLRYAPLRNGAYSGYPQGR
eukprot:TRINITY_DN10734_c0_g1_i1.p1 TRINITY_DN10734_c0_g1~~TRINITY_DN10734_c0_g1_i1.p1  ORF type:complete len:681 (+),score=101.02 TRINITY_DN10734_c0_g1_i1:74-2116(+)